MVRLKDSIKDLLARYQRFQFQYGTIKRMSDRGQNAENHSFNSNMVRLKEK